MNLRDHAKGKPCMIRIAGYCEPNRETTVLAHLRMAGITGGKRKPLTCSARGPARSVTTSSTAGERPNTAATIFAAGTWKASSEHSTR